MELAGILECRFHLNAFTFPFEVNDIMQHFEIIVQIFDEPNDSIRLMKLNVLCFRLSPVLIYDRQFRVQISGLMHPALNIIFPESGLLKNFWIWKKIDLRSGLLCLPDLWKKSVFKFYHRMSLCIAVMIHISALADFHIHIGGKGIDYRRSDTMQSSTRLVRIVVKFSSCVQCRKYNAGSRYSLCMHADRNTTSVIFHRTGAICLKGHPYFITGTCQMLIHGIVDNLINQVVESFGRCTSDIHSRTFPDRFKPLQYRYTACIIS